EGTSGSEIWVKDMKAPSSEFVLLVKGFDTEANVIENDGGSILVKTNADAPNYKVVLIDPKNPAKANWKTILPEKADLLQYTGTAGGKLFAVYLRDAAGKIYQSDFKGNVEREVMLPGIGTASGLGR